MANKKILLGLTTTPNSNWREKIKEIDELNLKEVALFLGPLERIERNELYALLKKTDLKSIPHVHLREEDMGRDEVMYFIEKYDAKVFNIHVRKECRNFIANNKELCQMVFLENLNYFPDNFEEILKNFGGICLDFSHYQDYGLLQNEKTYAGFEKLLDQYKIGCNHISAIKKTIQYGEDKQDNKFVGGYNDHFLSDLSELDYLKAMPKKYFADYISIELENPFAEQLKVKDYLEKIINN